MILLTPSRAPIRSACTGSLGQAVPTRPARSAVLIHRPDFNARTRMFAPLADQTDAGMPRLPQTEPLDGTLPGHSIDYVSLSH